MSSTFKKALKIILLGIASILVLLFLLGMFYGSEIKKLVIAELNKHLVAEISVKDFDLSLIKHFPSASINMKAFHMKEVGTPAGGDTLLAAEDVSLLFSVWDVFSKNVIIKKILIKNGSAFLHVDKEGSNNYEFWKSDEQAGSGSTALDLRLISLENVLIRYKNIRDEQDYLFKADKASISGKFADKEFSLHAKADLFMEFLYAGKINYVKGKSVQIESGLTVNRSSGTYEFEKSKVRIGSVDFDLKGTIKDEATNSRLGLTVNSLEAELTDLISLLPDEYIKYLQDFKSKGRFIFTANIGGLAGGGKIPDVSLDFGLRNGEIRPKESGVSLSSIQLQGKYTNRSGKCSSVLIIPDIKAELGGHPLNANLQLDDLENPFMQLKINAELNLAEVRHFITLDTLERLEGFMNVDIRYAGKVRDLKTTERITAIQVQSSGTIRLKNVSFKLKNNPLDFNSIGGTIALTDNDVRIEGLGGNISSTDLRLDGVFRNFINFIFIPGQSTDMNARMNSRLVNLDELLIDKSGSDAGDTSYIMKFNPRLFARLEVNIGKLQFRKFSASRIQGKIDLEKQVISGKGLTFASMDGMVYMDAMINASRKDSVIMSCDSRISRLDISKLFNDLENFGQVTLTDKNVRGRVSADVQFTSSWSRDLVINSDKVRAVCDITIENGELISFKPVQALARYLKVPDLNHIRFSTLKNSISIRDRKINIPAMEINSTALNLTASGTHDFDNFVDYRLKLLLSDVLGKKAKQQNSEFGEIEDDGLGRTQLFLTMKGPVDDPKFTYDRKAAGEKIKGDIAREKETFKSILKEEFGRKNKEPEKQEKKKKKEELEIDWDSPE